MLALPTRRFTHEEYHRMAEEGILHPDERVELLDGEIIPMFPIGPFHGGTVTWLAETFIKTSRNRWTLAPQNSLRLGLHSEPQPDIALLHHRQDCYRQQLPTPKDTFLVIEVADSSLLVDREKKIPLYAQAGIPEVWIVNVPQRLVEVFREPVHGQYQVRFSVQAGEPLAPAAFPEDGLDTANLLA